jgi:cephalosporin hydroxylase
LDGKYEVIVVENQTKPKVHDAGPVVLHPMPDDSGASARTITIRAKGYVKPLTISVAELMISQHRPAARGHNTWAGIPFLKHPVDAWMMQELIWKVKPDCIVELGTAFGGSSIFFCHMLDVLGNGIVVTVDTDQSRSRGVDHPRLGKIEGDAGDPEVVRDVKSWCEANRTMVIHDASHESADVYRDLKNYADVVGLDSYFIVEDGVVDLFNAPVGWSSVRPGPLDAIRRFLEEDDRFRPDLECERFGMTYNPHGYLRRVR